MKLTPRLQAIADWIEEGARLADIGTDHGRLPVYCVLNGVTSYTAACDIRELPLLSARGTAREHGVEDRMDFILSDGLDRVKEESVDTVVAAGMGGETIVSVLSRAEWIRRKEIRLILQPQSKIAVLQEWLAGNGFFTEKARLVRDGGRIYLVQRVLWDGTVREPDPYCLERLAGDGLLKEYASRLLTGCDKRLLAFRSGAGDPGEKKKLTDLRARLAELSGND